MNPIQVGVCGWGDHDLYPPGTSSRDKLALYAGHFPVVEVDSTYHAIPPVERCARWVEDTPEAFRFVVKAYRELTGHGRPKGAPERPWKEVADSFASALRPFQEGGKLSMVLFQFPPWFDCTREHVRHSGGAGNLCRSAPGRRVPQPDVVRPAFAKTLRFLRG